MTLEALRNADTEEAVYSMLTAYIAAAHSGNATPYLPSRVLRLPLAGRADAINRFLMLITAYELASQDADAGGCAEFTEALRVFGASVYRLTVLGTNPKMQGHAAGALSGKFQSENIHAA